MKRENLDPRLFLGLLFLIFVFFVLGTTASYQVVVLAFRVPCLGGATFFERVRRIELPSLAWEASVLPLYYTRLISNQILPPKLPVGQLSCFFIVISCIVIRFFSVVYKNQGFAGK